MRLIIYRERSKIFDNKNKKDGGNESAQGSYITHKLE